MKKTVKKPRRIDDDDVPVVDLSISPETVCFIILKAREFDVQDQVTDPDSSSNASDDGGLSILEAHRDNPVVEELVSVIAALDEDEEIDLVALAWLGRDDYTAADWPQVRADAAAAHNRKTASYLLGMPLLGDYLEEGLTMLGHSCTDLELDHL